MTSTTAQPFDEIMGKAKPSTLPFDEGEEEEEDEGMIPAIPHTSSMLTTDSGTNAAAAASNTQLSTKSRPIPFTIEASMRSSSPTSTPLDNTAAMILNKGSDDEEDKEKTTTPSSSSVVSLTRGRSMRDRPWARSSAASTTTAREASPSPSISSYPSVPPSADEIEESTPGMILGRIRSSSNRRRQSGGGGGAESDIPSTIATTTKTMSTSSHRFDDMSSGIVEPPRPVVSPSPSPTKREPNAVLTLLPPPIDTPNAHRWATSGLTTEEEQRTANATAIAAAAEEAARRAVEASTAASSSGLWSGVDTMNTTSTPSASGRRSPPFSALTSDTGSVVSAPPSTTTATTMTTTSGRSTDLASEYLTRSISKGRDVLSSIITGPARRSPSLTRVQEGSEETEHDRVRQEALNILEMAEGKSSPYSLRKTVSSEAGVERRAAPHSREPAALAGLDMALPREQRTTKRSHPWTRKSSSSSQEAPPGQDNRFAITEDAEDEDGQTTMSPVNSTTTDLIGIDLLPTSPIKKSSPDSDAAVLSGMVSREEMSRRTTTGPYNTTSMTLGATAALGASSLYGNDMVTDVPIHHDTPREDWEENRGGGALRMAEASSPPKEKRTSAWSSRYSVDRHLMALTGGKRSTDILEEDEEQQPRSARNMFSATPHDMEGRTRRIAQRLATRWSATFGGASEQPSNAQPSGENEGGFVFGYSSRKNQGSFNAASSPSGPFLAPPSVDLRGINLAERSSLPEPPHHSQQPRRRGIQSIFGCNIIDISAFDYENSDEETIRKKKRKRLFTLLLTAVFLAVAIAAVIGLSSPTPTSDVTQARSSDLDEAPVYLHVGEAFTFYATSDVPYDVDDKERLARDLNFLPDDADFLAHLGDVTLASLTNCAKSAYQDASAILGTSPAPVFVVPGNNDYTSCPDPKEAFGLWKENFGRFEENFEGHGFDVVRQLGRDENFSFLHKGVLFMGINLVDGMSDVQTDEERMLQHEQDVLWVEKNLQATGLDQFRAVVIFGHARPSAEQSEFFFPVVEAMKELSKPVLYMHGSVGDSSFLSYTPFDPVLGNKFRAVELEKGGNAPPVQVRIGFGWEPFSFDPRK